MLRIRNELEIAFQNPQEIEKPTEEMIHEVQERRKKLAELKDDDIYTCGEPSTRTSSVYVENPYDYPYLLQLAFNKMNEGAPQLEMPGFIVKTDSLIKAVNRLFNVKIPLLSTSLDRTVKTVLINQQIKQNLAHEYAHHVPLLGDEKGENYSYKVRYGVNVIRQDKEIKLQPHVALSGTIPAKRVREAMDAITEDYMLDIDHETSVK